MTDQPSYGPPPGQPPGPPPPGQPPGPPPGQPPPGGQYDPRWGYGPPGVPYGPPQNGGQGEETTWALFAYIGMAIVGFVAPLVIYCVKLNTSAFARFHAAQALNFQITLLIHIAVVAALCVPPAIILDNPVYLALFAVSYLEMLFGQWVFIIIGAIKAGKGRYWRIPTFFCFRMIR